MKIICPHCGKKYNYDKQMGICPSCTKYTSYLEVQRQTRGLISEVPKEETQEKSYSSVQKHSTNTNMSQRKGAFSKKMHSPMQDPSFSAKAHSKKNISTLNIVVSIIIAVTMIISLLSVFFYLVPIRTNELKENQKIENIDPRSFQIDEIVNGEKNTFTVSKPYVLDPLEYMPPAGWKYICFPYECYEYYDDFSDSYDSESYVYTFFETYLKVDDRYISPISSFDLPENNNEESIIKGKIESLNPSMQLENYGDNLIFLVPDESKEYILYLFECGNEDDFTTKKIMQVFELEIVEEE